jgi:hypothetical protein
LQLPAGLVPPGPHVAALAAPPPGPLVIALSSLPLREPPADRRRTPPPHRKAIVAAGAGDPPARPIVPRELLSRPPIPGRWPGVLAPFDLADPGDHRPGVNAESTGDVSGRHPVVVAEPVRILRVYLREGPRPTWHRLRRPRGETSVKVAKCHSLLRDSTKANCSVLPGFHSPQLAREQSLQAPGAGKSPYAETREGLGIPAGPLRRDLRLQDCLGLGDPG